MKTYKQTFSLLISLLAFVFAANAQDLAPALEDTVDNGDGSYTNWFGTFTPEGSLSNEGYINHDEHGMLYIIARGQNLWIYDPNVVALETGLNGWIYTNRNYFPYFMVRAEPTTFMLYVAGVEGPAGTPRVFVDIRTFDKLFLPKASTDTIVEIAAGTDSFSSLVTAVSTAGLEGALAGPGPLTVFAPTNDAFAGLDADTLNDLLTNPDSLPALTEILTYHVVPGRITAEMLGLDVISLLKGASVSGFVEALNGSDIRVDVTPFGVMLNGSAMVTTADIEAANGIIHVIDSVLLPPGDIVDTAMAAGFETLVTAVQAAGLESTLRGEGPFTVFAPTEEAFAALGTETLNSLIANPTALAEILTYHVVAGEVYSAAVSTGAVPTVNGAEATVSVAANGTLMIDGANIIMTDIVTSNGVIHVIDAVIQPSAE